MNARMNTVVTCEDNTYTTIYNRCSLGSLPALRRRQAFSFVQSISMSLHGRTILVLSVAMAVILFPLHCAGLIIPSPLPLPLPLPPFFRRY